MLEGGIERLIPIDFILVSLDSHILNEFPMSYMFYLM